MPSRPERISPIRIGIRPPEPGSPFSTNLTPGGVLAIWTAADFIETMRTGVTPYGRQLDSSFMPYEDYSRLTNDDLTAMFLYLQSLPAFTSLPMPKISRLMKKYMLSPGRTM